jgi:hypothetical protein
MPDDALNALLNELADTLDESAAAFFRHQEMTRWLHCKALAEKARVAIAGGAVLPYHNATQ